MHPLLEKQLEEIQNSDNEVIVIPGLGGHSGASWAQVLNSHNNINFVLIFNSFDDGGDTGKVTAALGTPSMGDFRNTLGHIWEVSGNFELKNLASIFNQRVNNFYELKILAREALMQIAKISGRNEIGRFDIEKYIDIYEAECQKLDPDYLYGPDGNLIKHNVGNIILSALYTHLGGIDELVYAFKSCLLINKNIYCVSMAENENVELRGIDEEGNLIRREKNIDNHRKRIALKSLFCARRGTNPSENYTTKNEFISEVIKLAKMINFPQSSPNNWSVITKMYQDEITYALSKVDPAIAVCWTPVTQEENTFGIADIILYLWEMFPNKVKFIIPETPDRLIQEHFFEYGNILKAYRKEGKTLQLFNLNQFAEALSYVLENFYPNLNVFTGEEILRSMYNVSGSVSIVYDHPDGEVYEIPLTSEQSDLHARLALENRGIKHNPKFMTEFIKRLIESNWELSCEVFKEIEKEVNSNFRSLANIETRELKVRQDNINTELVAK